jgi:hypothetical protein
MALTFDDTQAVVLLELLGLPADTTDVQLVLDTVSDLAAQVAEIDPAKPSTVAAAAKRAGLEVLDTDTAAALRHDAAEGRKIAAAAARKKVEDTVAAAVNKGKITPARRKHWVNLITADPEMAEVLAKVPDETAVPMTEIGHGVGDEDGARPREGWFY